jgi:hypothetical protein
MSHSSDIDHSPTYFLSGYRSGISHVLIFLPTKQTLMYVISDLFDMNEVFA